MTEQLLGFVAQPSVQTETWLEKRRIPAHRQPYAPLGYRWSHRTWSWWVRVR